MKDTLKQRLSLLLTLALLLTCLPALSLTVQAETIDFGSCGTKLIWTLDDTGTLTISGTGAIANYTTKSFAPWYSYRSSIKNVVLQPGVTRIGNYAFYNCANLTGITIPDSLTSIGESAFAHCSRLTGITIPEGLTSIGDFAFYYCTAMEKIDFNASAMNHLSPSNCMLYQAGQSGKGITVNIGAKVTRIPAYLFCPYNSSSSAPKLAAVNFAEGSTCVGIGTYSFAYCDSLTGITLPESVTKIGADAFRSCHGLTSIRIAEGNSVYHSAGNCVIETASKMLILGCKTSQIPQDGSVTSIGNYAFFDCDGLTSITIPDSVTGIGEHSFYECDGLTSITIPDSVTGIGNCAFTYCDSLTSVTIGNSLTSIGICAFYNCKSLTEINFNATAMNNLLYGSNVFAAIGLMGVTVNIGANVTRIPACLFCTSSSTAPRLSAVNFAEGSVCTDIGAYAFDGCWSLPGITLPDSVTSIGNYAFRGCTDLKRVMFKGKAPEAFGSDVFSEVTATAYYHPDETWTEAVMQNYGGTITWVASNGLPGDLDGNLEVNSDDVVQLLLHISMPDFFPIDADADYTGDGKVTSDDVVQLLLHISMPDLFPLQ